MEKIIEHEWDEEDDDREMMIGSSSPSEGKMVIKLKIPKVAMEGEESSSSKRVCLVCNKEFSSGKALGGHMRVHAHAHIHGYHLHRNPNFLKPTKPKLIKKPQDSNNGDPKPYYMNCVNDQGEPTCSLCGKTFPSMKSLFGHMRCHPERVWRGIVPPPTTVNRRSVEADEVVDLTKVLSGWSVTARRGRKSLKPAEDDEGLLGAVEDLLSLANGGGGGGGGSMAESTTEVGHVADGKGKTVMVEETDDDDQQLLVNYSFKKIKKKKKKMKLMMELEQQQKQQQEEVVTVDECKYKCSTCNKTFATHQALGGHRSSHNKSKMVEEDHESYVMVENIMEIKGLHQCKICNKVFATGQALGGHKRCHWTGTIEPEAQVEAPLSQITSTGEAASQTTGTGRKVFDFDLNEIPPGIMEEDANGYGYGYASSSYNSNMC